MLEQYFNLQKFLLIIFFVLLLLKKFHDHFLLNLQYGKNLNYQIFLYFIYHYLNNLQKHIFLLIIILLILFHFDLKFYVLNILR